MNFKFEKNKNKSLEIEAEDIDENIVIKLQNSKSTIDACVDKWDIVKKKIHKYEYVYTSPIRNRNITGFIPVSRSYFKLKEIIQEHGLIKTDNLKIFCMAEAPGGFIQSLLEYKSKIDNIGAITLLSNDINVPFWNKIIKENSLVQLYDGHNKDGDICSFKNIISIIKDIGKNSVDILTGDGGFDYSNDYNKQELNSLPLIYSEIFMALNLQKKGGSFICKVFDLFLKETIKLIYILYLSYEEIIINKPCLSRLSNSEKYIVCKKFKGYNPKLINELCRSFDNKNVDLLVSSEFYNKIQNFNILYTNQQIKQIEQGVKLIYNNKLNRGPNREQIYSAVEWCNKYKISINKSCMYLRTTS